jgi:hypothetical protein
MVRGDPKYDQKRTGSRQQALKLSHIEGPRRGDQAKVKIAQWRARTEPIRKTACFTRASYTDRFASDSYCPTGIGGRGASTLPASGSWRSTCSRVETMPVSVSAGDAGEG